MKPSQLLKHIREVLRSRFQETTGNDIDKKGYVRRVEGNLLPGGTLDMCQQDMEHGNGKELEGKFRAVHSSSALAVNTFALFKYQPAFTNKKIILLYLYWQPENWSEFKVFRQHPACHPKMP